MKVGYIRVSTVEQNEGLQYDALLAAGCEKFFTDKITGSKIDRKGMNEALDFMRNGDVFVVWKLDRAGRSLQHLIEFVDTLKARDVAFMSITESIETITPGGKLFFHLMGAIAEFERDLLRERTNAGLAAARARGHFGGRPEKLTKGDLALAQRMYADPANSIRDIYEHFGIGRSTLFRHIGPKAQAERARKEQEVKAARSRTEQG